MADGEFNNLNWYTPMSVLNRLPKLSHKRERQSFCATASDNSSFAYYLPIFQEFHLLNEVTNAMLRTLSAKPSLNEGAKALARTLSAKPSLGIPTERRRPVHISQELSHCLGLHNAKPARHFPLCQPHWGGALKSLSVNRLLLNALASSRENAGLRRFTYQPLAGPQYFHGQAENFTASRPCAVFASLSVSPSSSQWRIKC